VNIFNTNQVKCEIKSTAVQPQQYFVEQLLSDQHTSQINIYVYRMNEKVKNYKSDNRKK